MTYRRRHEGLRHRSPALQYDENESVLNKETTRDRLSKSYSFRADAAHRLWRRFQRSVPCMSIALLQCILVFAVGVAVACSIDLMRTVGSMTLQDHQRVLSDCYDDLDDCKRYCKRKASVSEMIACKVEQSCDTKYSQCLRYGPQKKHSNKKVAAAPATTAPAAAAPGAAAVPAAAAAPAATTPVKMTLQYNSTSQGGGSVAFDDANRQFDCDKIGTLCADHICCGMIELSQLPTEKVTPARFTWGKDSTLEPICVGKKDERTQIRLVLAQATNGGALSLIQFKDWTFEKVTKYHMCKLYETCKEGKRDCDENLRNCLGRVNHPSNEGLMRYPSKRVAANSFQFGRDHGCNGQQWIDGRECESNAVLCTPSEIEGMRMTQAVLKCGDRVFSRPLFKHGTGWCVNEYQDKEGVSVKKSTDRDHLTLEQMLIEEVGATTAVVLLRDVFKPKVQSFWHWGDARTALEYVLPREAFRSVQEYTRWDKHFEDLTHPSKARETFPKYRACTFGDMDKLKNCAGKLVTPWDLLQDAWDEKALLQSNGVPSQGTDNAKGAQAKGAQAKGVQAKGAKSTQEKPKQPKESKAKPNITLYVFIVVLSVLIFAY